MVSQNVALKENTIEELRIAKSKFLKTSKLKPTNDNVINKALKGYNNE